jgi:hypothetical protein
MLASVSRLLTPLFPPPDVDEYHHFSPTDIFNIFSPGSTALHNVKFASEIGTAKLLLASNASLYAENNEGTHSRKSEQNLRCFHVSNCNAKLSEGVSVKTRSDSIYGCHGNIRNGVRQQNGVIS